MSKVKKNRELLHRHIICFNSSPLSGAEYCRQNNLVYSQFLYWRSKYAENVNSMELSKPGEIADDFIPVNVPALTEKQSILNSSTGLCSVDYPHGQRLVIYSGECLKILPKILGVPSGHKSLTNK